MVAQGDGHVLAIDLFLITLTFQAAIHFSLDEASRVTRAALPRERAAEPSDFGGRSLGAR